MSRNGDDGRVLHMPHPPDGVLAVVEAKLRYWSAIRDRAIGEGDRSGARTADGIVRSYEAMRAELGQGVEVDEESAEGLLATG